MNNFVRLTRLIRRNGGGFTEPDVVRYIIITSAVLCTRGTRARFAGVRQWRGRDTFNIFIAGRKREFFIFFSFYFADDSFSFPPLAGRQTITVRVINTTLVAPADDGVCQIRLSAVRNNIVGSNGSTRHGSYPRSRRRSLTSAIG